MIDTEITVNLDYQKVRSIDQIIQWAQDTFTLPAESGESIASFTHRLYHHIGKGSVGYTIIEHNIDALSSALEAVISAPHTGWKSSLVSGIAHDYGLHVTFSQAPQKHRKWWWPWHTMA